MAISCKDCTSRSSCVFKGVVSDYGRCFVCWRVKDLPDFLIKRLVKPKTFWEKIQHNEKPKTILSEKTVAIINNWMLKRFKKSLKTPEYNHEKPVPKT